VTLIGTRVGRESDVAEYRRKSVRQRGKGMKKGRFSKVFRLTKRGSVKSSASKRADGIAKKGKTRGKMV
jgi:hypothetical protein